MLFIHITPLWQVTESRWASHKYAPDVSNLISKQNEQPAGNVKSSEKSEVKIMPH